MILTLALRNLLHDRVRLAVTLVGILFSIVLVAVQLGLYLGSSRMITANIARSNADLFVTTYGAKSFEDGGVLLTDRKAWFPSSFPLPNGANPPADRRESFSLAPIAKTKG
jgi:putative ABC transport system permease protein